MREVNGKPSRGIPGYVVWQGYTGIWYWQLTDKRGGILSQPVDGQAQSESDATSQARAAQTRHARYHG